MCAWKVPGFVLMAGALCTDLVFTLNHFGSINVCMCIVQCITMRVFIPLCIEINMISNIHIYWHKCSNLKGGWTVLELLSELIML